MRRVAPLLVAGFLLLATALGQAAEAKTLFLIRGPEGAALVRAQSFEKQGNVFVITTDTGSKAIVQATNILGELPWHSDEEIASGAVDAGVLAASYEIAAKRFPAARKPLLDEAARYREVLEKKAAQERARKAEAEARVATAIAPVYDVKAPYSAEQLEELLAAADGAREATSDAPARIDAWAKPFRDHLAHLERGDTHEGGRWVTADERAAAAKAAATAAFRQRVDHTISASSAPMRLIEEQARRWIMAAAIAAGLGLALIIVGRKWLVIRGIGALLFTVPPVIVAVVVYVATRDPGAPGPSGATDEAGMKLLAYLAGVEPSWPGELSQDDLNAFAARHILIEGDAAPDIATRAALAATLRPGEVSVFELLRALGREWIVRYDLARGADGSWQPRGVRFGALDCPKPLAEALWASLQPQLGAVVAATGVPARFPNLEIAEGTLKLGPSAAAPAADPPTP